MRTLKSLRNTKIPAAMIMKHYAEITKTSEVLRAAPNVPAEGWIRTIRKALDMSGAQLARRLKLSRNRVSVMERSELEGALTLKQMQTVAETLGCDFVYGLVPKQDVEKIKRDQAERIAEEYVDSSNQQMLLEAQGVGADVHRFLLDQVINSLLEKGGRVLWQEKPERPKS